MFCAPVDTLSNSTFNDVCIISNAVSNAAIQKALVTCSRADNVFNVDNCYSCCNITTDLDAFIWNFCIGDNVDLSDPTFYNLRWGMLAYQGKWQSTIDWDWKDCHDLDACKPYLSFHYWWYYFNSNSGMSTFLFSCSWNPVCRHLGSLTVTLRWIHVWFLDQDFFGETVTPTTTGTTTTSTGSTKGSIHYSNPDFKHVTVSYNFEDFEGCLWEAHFFLCRVVGSFDGLGTHSLENSIIAKWEAE